MDNSMALALALVAGLAVGGGASWLVWRARSDAGVALAASLKARLDAVTAERDRAWERADEVLSDRAAQASEFKALAHETLQLHQRGAEESAELRQRATEHLLRPVRDGLEAFNRRLADVESQRAAMTADLRAQVQAVQQTGEAVRRETASLATALRKPHVRGAWGELQLRRVVELAGMLDHCDFFTQQTGQTSDGRAIRPDLKVQLSGGRYVYVDSKVPLAAFLDAYDTDDEAARAASLAAFGRNVRTHVDQLSGKAYFKAGVDTPEFVVLFIPSESLAAEAVEQLPDLHEYAARRNIVLATPTTLIALLRAVAYGWRQAALADSAAEVFALGRELYDRLGLMGTHFDKLGRSLNAAVRAYNTTLGSLETRVLVTGRRLRDLDLTDADLASPAPVDEAARPVAAAELAAALADDLAEGDVTRSELPERGELGRGVPDVAELVDGHAGPGVPLPGLSEPGQRRVAGEAG